jgi:hypothetical protein
MPRLRFDLRPRGWCADSGLLCLRLLACGRVPKGLLFTGAVLQTYVSNNSWKTMSKDFFVASTCEDLFEEIVFLPIWSNDLSTCFVCYQAAKTNFLQE